jgi:hypothetical protein
VLEVSTKPDFPSNFTQHRVSSRSSELILEALADDDSVYWRVRTADRAGNLSDWSATNTFTTGLSGSLPSVLDGAGLSASIVVVSLRWACCISRNRRRPARGRHALR